MDSNDKSKMWNEGLKLVSYCPLCETRYNPMEAKVLGEQDETHLLHITCRKCSNSILTLILLSNVGMSSVGLVTDLRYEDVIRFDSKNRVTTNDVIEIHQFLKMGDWSRLVP